MDSILVNGKGAVNCLPQQELNSLVNPNLATVLQQANLQVTDKGSVLRHIEQLKYEV